MKNPYKVIKSMLRTEKGSQQLLPLNKHSFWVDINANKIDIKNAVEDIYNVKVAGVNTYIRRGKKRRVRYQQGLTPDRKQAVVTLKKESKIDIT